MTRSTGPPALLPLLVLGLVLRATALPPAPRAAPRAAPNFVGEGTNELATLILQGYEASEKNLAFSPLGYSALLAILAEGAGGETRRQLVSALHLPEDPALTRTAYRDVLDRLREKNMVNKPELRNWFYVYKNHTVEQDYRDVLNDFYLTEVKSVTRPVEDMGFEQVNGAADSAPSQQSEPAETIPTQQTEQQEAIPTQQTEQQEVIPAQQTEQQEALEEPGRGDIVTSSEIDAAGGAIEEAMTLGAMKEGALIETALAEEAKRVQEEAMAAEKKPMAEEQKPEMPEGQPMMDEQKPMAAESGVIMEDEQKPMKEVQKPMKDEQKPMMDEQKPMMDEQKPMKDEQKPMMDENKPLGAEQMPMEPMKVEQKPMEDGSKLEAPEEEEKQKPMKDEKPMIEQQKPDKQQEQQLLQMQQMADEETPEEPPQQAADEKEFEELMMTSERKGRQLKEPELNGLTSGLSGNTLNAKNPEGPPSARMLLFNGMYFRGSWRTPFAPLEQPDAFYVGEDKKVSAPMMRAKGAFLAGEVPELDACAVELPYEGDRYSLLVLLPKSRTGLRGLVADLAGYSLRNVHASMQSQETEVTLPCFAVETITRPIPIFTKAGVSDVFLPDSADLNGISKVPGLYVQDLVQLVTVRVDNSSSTLNHLTSSALESRTGNLDKIVVDHPFLYFVRDTVDNIVMVAGKVVNPNERPKNYA